MASSAATHDFGACAASAKSSCCAYATSFVREFSFCASIVSLTYTRRFALPSQRRSTLPPPGPLTPTSNATATTQVTPAIPSLPPLPDFPAPAVGVGADANALYPPAPSTSAENSGGTSDWLDMLSWSATGATTVEGSVEGAPGADAMPEAGDGGDWAKSGDFSWLWPGGDMVHSGL